MPNAVPVFNAFDIDFYAQPQKVKGMRGNDRAKQEFEWHDVKKVYEFEDGWYIGHIDDHRDMTTLGWLMGHCAATHFVWVIEERIWYFFALFDPKDVPHSTLHAKQASWMHKRHPRDDAEDYPPEVRTWKVMYPSFEQVTTCFEAAGKKYEPGKYKATGYNSCGYDYGAENDYGQRTFANHYGNPRVIRDKPAEVDTDVWNTYVKACKAIEDNFNKNAGAIKLAGRRFKFDNKWLILLSATEKSQGSVVGGHAKRVHEWLNSTGKKEKAVGSSR